MDAEILENQLKQRLSSRNMTPVNIITSESILQKSNAGASNGSSRAPSNVPSRSASAEPLNRTSSRQELSAATVGSYEPPKSLSAMLGAANPSEPSIRNFPPLPPDATTSETVESRSSRLSARHSTQSLLKPSFQTTSSSSLPDAEDAGQLKRQFLPEAPPVGEQPKPSFDPSEVSTVFGDSKSASAQNVLAADKQSEGESLAESDWGEESERSDDEDWNTLEYEEIDESVIKRFADLTAQIRSWMVKNHAKVSPSRSLVDELLSGVMLCILLSKIANKDEVLDLMTMEYSPAMANLTEWKNLEVFLTKAKEYYPGLSDFSCTPRDLYNKADIPNFLAFLYLLAKASGTRLETIEAGEAVESDIAMLKRQRPSTLQNALTIIDEDEHRKASPVYTWLKEARMDIYFDGFEERGWDDLEKIELMEESDLRAVGVEKDGHVKLLMKRIADLSLLKQWLLTSYVDHAFHAQDVLPAVADSAEMVRLESELNALHNRVRKTKLQGMEESLHVARSLVSAVSPSYAPSIVIDFTAAGTAIIGVAGSLVPACEIPIDLDKESPENILDVVKRAISKLGHDFAKRSKRIFVCGTMANRALQEGLLQLAPKGLFVCGPKSTAALALRAVGLADGVSLDVDFSNVARAIAVQGGRAIPQGFTTEVISSKGQNEEHQKRREKAMLGMIASCISECGFASSTNKRIKGGLVITGTKLPLTAGIVKRFSSGLFVVGSVARWGAASQVASHPDFQHRWLTRLPYKLHEEPLFPLMQDTMRRQLAIESVQCATVLERTLRMKEEAARLDELNARNASQPQFATLPPSPGKRPQISPRFASTPLREPQEAPKGRPLVPKRPAPHPAKKQSPKAASPKTVSPRTSSPRQPVILPPDFPKELRTDIPMVDVHVARLMEHVTTPKAIHEFRVFLLEDCSNNKGLIAKRPFSEVLKVLPAGLKKVMKQAGFIFMDDDDDEDGVEELAEML